MIIESNLEKVKGLIKKEKKPVVILAQNDDFNRKILEYGRFDILLSPESGARKNSIRHSDSGLNEVLANIAAKNNVAIGIDIGEISNLKKEQKAEKLEKIRQNIRICRKSKTKLKAVGSKDKNNTVALLTSLGASSQQAKEAISL